MYVYIGVRIPVGDFLVDYFGYEMAQQILAVLVLEMARVEDEELRVLGAKGREDLGVKRREKRLQRYMYVRTHI
jgi:hypothetical protein